MIPPDASIPIGPDLESVRHQRARPESPLPAETRMGPVHLDVADLDRSVAFYAQAVGLEVTSARREAEGGARAALGVGGTELVGLREVPGARPSRGHSGLYHLALRVPERADLARWLAHAARTHVALDGASDHGVSEAIYLTDPDGHGIEVYRDRPRARWEGRVARTMTIESLDVQDLLAAIGDPRTAPFDGLPPGTDMGHVHFRVADVPAATAFYRDVLGFDVTASYGGMAAFLSAGGYHHHVAVNAWGSAGAGQPSGGTAVLRYATILLPDASARDAVVARLEAGGTPVERTSEGAFARDPSGNRLLLDAVS